MGDELAQPRRDFFMDARVRLVAAHHIFVMRDVLRIQSIANTQVGGQPIAHIELEALERRQPGIQRRRRHHQARHRPHAQRHESPGNQPAHAVAQQDQRQGLVRVTAIPMQRTRPGVVDDLGQVVQQRAITGHRAARAA